ncbi:hypothetical protein [Kitasatospora cinereorecta]|uniref:Lipoprotein n=1 Tax=Kitasatospora cinereorecta TaxID=285560 RepID=A0ABW0VH45_9ACTN
MSMRTLALSVLAASVVLSVSACDPMTATPGQPADAAATKNLAAPASSDDSASAMAADAAGSPAVTLLAPAADRIPTEPTASPSAAHAEPKASGGSSASGTPKPAVVPSAPASDAAALKLDSYDQKSGKAVLAVTTNGTKGDGKASNSPSPAPSPSASAAAVAAVRPGQLIDSPPSAVAPRGALLAITDVQAAGPGKVAVSTRPATISELLGQTWANIKSALDPHKIQVTPKLKDLKASYVPKPGGGADGSASAVLQLDANDTVPLPGGGKATLNGSLELDPSVMFSYQGSHGILAPEQAKVGFDLGAHANWHLSAGLTGSTGQVKIPIATLTATPTVMVAQVPVVISLNVTVYAEVSADGTVTVDTTQQLDGSWAMHADYTKAGGWTSTTEPVSTKISPVKASFTGKASVRTGLVADGSVALYDAVGVKATVEPYLRADVDGSVSIDSASGVPAVHGKAGLYGGLDVNGAVLARIAILGTPLVEKDIPFKLYHNEWTIVSREAGTGAAAGASSGAGSAAH